MLGMGFPFEIITMLGSTILGGVMSVWAESRKAKAEHQKLLITRGEFELKARKQETDAVVAREKLNLDQQKLATQILKQDEGNQIQKEKLASQILKEGIN